ncbi:heparinase II/III family protein [Bacillus sp. JJ664]
MKLFKRLIIVFLIVFIIMALFKDSSPLRATEVKTNNSIQYIQRIKPSKSVVSFADQIIDNKIYLGSQFPIYQLDNEITWKEDPFKNRTWQLFLHSFEHVGYLLSAYEYTNDVKYLIKSEYFIKSWQKVNSNPKKATSPWAWYTNSVPIRTVYLIQFANLYKLSSIYNESNYNEIVDLIIEHGSFLANNNNYVWDSNHGIFQDQALIEIAVLFPNLTKSSEWYNIGTNRLKRHVESLITTDGITKEHSISYQIVVIDLIRQILPLLKESDNTKLYLENKIGLLEDTLATFTQPNGTIPQYGDSKNSYVANKNLNVNEIRGNKLKYLNTNGQFGVNPFTDILYKNSGISIFRNRNNNVQSYLFFVSAFHSTVHKHADDLSFIFTKGNTEFFVDSGLYNYELNDSYRNYLISTYAHNTITIDNKSYQITKENIGKAKIQSGYIYPDYSYVVGKHTLYPGVIVQRVLLYLKESDTVLIFDKIISKKIHTYSKVFNLGENVNLSQRGKNEFNLTSKIDQNKLEFINLDVNAMYQSYYGSKNPIAGFKSNTFNKIIPINQMRFTVKGSNYNFRSIINSNIYSGVKSFYVTGDSNSFNFEIKYKSGLSKDIIIKLN